jgi:IS5 family transposase
MHRSRERLVRLAERTGVALRQTYKRVGKYALIKHQRYAHAKQPKMAGRALKTLKIYLGRVIRDIVRKIKGREDLEAAFAQELMLARRVHAQNKNLRPIKGAPKDADLRVFRWLIRSWLKSGRKPVCSRTNEILFPGYI